MDKLVEMDEQYREWISEVSSRFRQSQIKSLSANKQLWYNSYRRRWKKWRKRATSHGQYQMRSGRP